MLRVPTLFLSKNRVKAVRNEMDTHKACKPDSCDARKSTRAILQIALIAVLVLLYWRGAIWHLEQVNTNMSAHNQQSFMRYAKNLKEHNYDYLGDRNRMPLYPFLQSLFYDSEMSSEEFFERGKYVNVVLSIVLLLATLCILSRYFSALATAAIMLILSFTVYIFKAAYFQSELLFYFLNACAFVLMCETMSRPSWKMGILTGITLGMAHLTKASVLPGFVLFLVFAASKRVYILHSRNRPVRHARPSLHDKKESLHAMLSISLALLSFLGVVFPYIRNSKKMFGSYFYNVNSTFYMWYDSWEEVKQGTRAHGDRKGWPDMPPELIPSPRRYLREHSAQQMARRVLDGLSEIHRKARTSYGFYKYVLIYLAFLLVTILLDVRRAIQLARQHVFLLLFGLCYFAGYLVLYAWYVPIGSGIRFVLAQFIPFMFSVIYTTNRLSVRSVYIKSYEKRLKVWTIFNALVLLLVIHDIHSVLTNRILTVHAGN